MHKLTAALCTVLLLVATLSVGGVFASFQYAQGGAKSENTDVNTSLGEFTYNTGLTAEMQAVLDCAINDLEYGLNSGNFQQGMFRADEYLKRFRAHIGYIGTTDKDRGSHVYGSTVYPQISVIMTLERDDRSATRFLYMVQKSNAELQAMNEGDTLANVFRITLKLNANYMWEIATLPNGAQQIEKGHSPIQLYQYPGYIAQHGGEKTFGFYFDGASGGTEIWVKD